MTKISYYLIEKRDTKDVQATNMLAGDNCHGLCKSEFKYI